LASMRAARGPAERASARQRVVEGLGKRVRRFTANSPQRSHKRAHPGRHELLCPAHHIGGPAAAPVYRSSGAAGGVGVMRLHVGCAMWTHKAWQGRFLAHPAPAHERLRCYAGWCNAVEANTTFYATPARDTVACWAEQTDPDFRFVIKLPKR